MTSLRLAFQRVRGLVHRNWDRELNDEIEFHIESLAGEFRQQGLSHEEARARARREFGGVDAMKEQYRDRQSLPFAESLLIDLKQATRYLVRSPRVTVIAVLALAVGIGATTAIYSVMDAIVLRPLPYPNSDRMVRIQRVFPQGNGPAVSVPKYTFLREHAQSLQQVAAFSFAGPGWNLSDGAKPEQVRGVFASHEYFAAFGITAALGRTYTAGEDRPGGANVTVLSHSLWKNKFGGDPYLVGRTITLNDQLYTVIGVLKPFASWPRSDLWVPLRADPGDTNPAHYLNAVAQIKDGVTFKQASAEAETLAAQYKATHKIGFGEKETWRPFSLQETLVGDTKGLMSLLMAAVVLVLLIASANVANLLLARSVTRQREMAIRMAIGAGARRVIRQVLTECVLLSLIAGILGTVLGLIGIKAPLALVPGDLPRQEELTLLGLLHWRAGLFALIVSISTGILFGMAPALQLRKADLNATLKEASGRSQSANGHRGLRSLLVVAEIGLSVVLLIGAGLLFRSYVGLRHVMPGLEPKNLTVFSTSLSGARYQSGKGVENFVEQSVTRLESSTGIQAAGMSYSALLEGSPDVEFRIEGRALDGGKQTHGDSNIMPVGGSSRIRTATIRSEWP